MIYRYAQIYKSEDGFGYPECDSYLSGEVIAENMIRLEEDFDLTNKRWNYTTSKWESYEPEVIPEPEPQPTQLDIIESKLDKSQDEIRQEGADLLMTELQQRGIISLHNAGGYCLTSNLFNWFGGVAA